MKNYILLLIAFGLFTACYQNRPISADLFLYSKQNTEIKVEYFDDDYKRKEEIIEIPSLKDYGFFASTKYKDERPFLFKICRTSNTINDTIFINSKHASIELNTYNSCALDVIVSGDSANCPTIQEVLQHYRNTNNPYYFELLPNQQCIEIPLN